MATLVINQEDLLKPKLFLIFLSSQCAGSEFPIWSLRISRWRVGSFRHHNWESCLRPFLCNEHTMPMFTGRNTPEYTESSLAWDEHLFDLCTKRQYLYIHTFECRVWITYRIFLKTLVKISNNTTLFPTLPISEHCPNVAHPEDSSRCWLVSMWRYGW